MNNKTIENLYAAAIALNIPNEYLSISFSCDSVITISCKTGAKWDARTGKNGKIRISTLRPCQ